MEFRSIQLTVRNDLQFIKGIVGINSNVPDILIQNEVSFWC